MPRTNHEHIDNAFTPGAPRPSTTPAAPKGTVDPTEKALAKIFEPLVRHAASDLTSRPSRLAILKLRLGLRTGLYQQSLKENVEHKKLVLNRIARSALTGHFFEAIGHCSDLISFTLPSEKAVVAISEMTDADVVTRSAKKQLDGDFEKLRKDPSASSDMLKLLEESMEDMLLKQYSESDPAARAKIVGNAVSPTRVLDVFDAAQEGYAAALAKVNGKDAKVQDLHRDELVAAMRRLNTARIAVVQKQQEFANFKETMKFLRTEILPASSGPGNRSLSDMIVEINKQLAGPKTADYVHLQRSKAFLVAAPDMMKKRWQSTVLQQLATTYSAELGSAPGAGFITQLTKRMNEGMAKRETKPPRTILLGQQRMDILRFRNAARLSALRQLAILEKPPADKELKKMEDANRTLEPNPTAVGYLPAPGAKINHIAPVAGLFLPDTLRPAIGKTVHDEVDFYVNQMPNSLRLKANIRSRYNDVQLAKAIIDGYIKEGPPHQRAHAAGMATLGKPATAIVSSLTAPQQKVYWTSYNTSLAKELTPAVSQAVQEVAEEYLRQVSP